jgi:hypothetical protein
MPDKWPLANGNWSNSANWNGGTLPVDGDDIYLDNRTITLDQTINLPNARLLTTARSGGTAGGVLTVTSPTTADVTLLSIVAGASVVLNIASSLTSTISVATVSGSLTTININAITVGAGSHSITFSGCEFRGGSGSNRHGLTIAGGSGTVTFANSTAVGGLGGSGVVVTGGTAAVSGTLNLTNIGAATTQSVNFSVNPTEIVLSGTCVMTGQAGLLIVSNGATVKYTCVALSFVNPINSPIQVFGFSTATIGNQLIFSSPVTMHNQSAGPALAGLGATGGLVCVIGDVTGGTGGVFSIFQISNGTIERIGEDFLGNSVGANSLCALANNSAAFFIADKIRCAAGGHLPLMIGAGLRFKSTSRIIAQDSLGNPVILQPPASLVDLPVPSDVREGVSYNNSTQVGTYNAGSEIAADVWTYATRTITAGGLDAAGVRAAVGLAAANLDSQLGNIETKLDAVRGPGNNTWTILVRTASGSPIAGCECWVATDSDGANAITDIQTTDANGQIEFLLDPGTYYLFRRKTGYTFTNPQTITVS